MPDKHPYISGGGPITKAVRQFRKTLPQKIDAGTLKKLGIAPNNETYLINILRFLDIIADDGTPTAAAKNVFSQHDDAAFSQAFGNLVKKAYKGLFELHKDAWELDSDKLITFFRQADQTSGVVGPRQATTFQTLASLSGHGAPPAAQKSPKPPKASVQGHRKRGEKLPTQIEQQTNLPGGSNMGLTVRIEVNLPAAGDQETYDRIFRSIRENLLNA